MNETNVKCEECGISHEEASGHLFDNRMGIQWDPELNQSPVYCWEHWWKSVAGYVNIPPNPFLKADLLNRGDPI